MPNSSEQFAITPDGYAPRLKRLRQLSGLLDNIVTIPGTQVGIGLDPIMGLLPIGGDALGLIFSFYIIMEAAQIGVSRATLGRMVMNVIVDCLVGAIPMLGDLFDFAWKANNYNIILLEESLKSPHHNKKADQSFIFIFGVGLFLLAIVLISIPVILLRILWQVFTGS
ncbi:DUF4112 domain-containing protein [Anabaena sp. UHCC 0187]|uniref:DUF4112 domain-containing protein n=1 Tax=Anabaena sp. UHCC 0187 TaxID=2590018 RepID=UPI0014477B76|nr:DUF4112 domain-containing protein [Anabaena sp. UHCC 0187]MDP5016742.1 DUF4112 domain-containing protein [Dolichospermum sp.]MTJ11067.1 DUF4112 domain-containing protein [Anabaena sp. UHCC 0187]